MSDLHNTTHDAKLQSLVCHSTETLCTPWDTQKSHRYATNLCSAAATPAVRAVQAERTHTRGRGWNEPHSHLTLARSPIPHNRSDDTTHKVQGFDHMKMQILI